MLELVVVVVMNSQTLGVDMDPVTTAALVSGGSQVLGSLLGGKPQVRHDSAHGETEGAIRAKMEAAEKYGISKLYALGAPAVGGSTTVVGGDNSLGSAISNMGADVSRAVANQQTNAERALQALTLDKASLENDYLREQIRSIRLRTLREAAPSKPVVNAPGVSFDTPVYSPDVFTPDYSFLGIPMRGNPYGSDSQTVTNRLGESELLEMINAIGTGGMDAYWTVMAALTGDPYYRKGNRLDVRR